jgi:AAA15 family ATPase/GTPase
MLDHLHIQNYRLFKELHLEPLRRVNLITGKNNTGKTAILEAIRIIDSEADESVICNIIYKRNDFGNERLYTESSIFFNYSLNNDIILNDLKILFEYTNQRKTSGNVFSSQNGSENKRILIVTNNMKYPNDESILIPFDTSFDNVALWKTIDLSPRKKDIIAILKTVENKILDVGLDIETKLPKILLTNLEFPIPLKHLGDGINRIFTIALALVNAKNKILLIDEIDLGLHHSVQKKLWEIIFKFSKELNVQVFATTHSQDCVEAFTHVLNEKDNENEGQYIRLQRSRLDESVIEPIYYDAQKLKNSINYHLETR